MTEQAKITLPIVVGKKYVRRDGVVVTVTGTRAEGIVALTDSNAPFSDIYASNGCACSPNMARPSDLVADYVEPAAEQPKPAGHPHAASMLLYAQDAAETDKPWERWQVARPGPSPKWFGFDAVEGDAEAFPTWDVACIYRRKPKTIRVGEVDVPAPLRVAPERMQLAYLVNMIAGSVNTVRWEPCYESYLARGLVYLNEADAQLMVAALTKLLAPKD
jgi:hypothetical protein